jgi:TolA-binding protein
MITRSYRSIFCALSFLLLLGCSDKPKELFETAAFEENQGNIAHAKEIYEELVRSYPSSKEAELAKAHLTDLK